MTMAFTVALWAFLDRRRAPRRPRRLRRVRGLVGARSAFSGDISNPYAGVAHLPARARCCCSSSCSSPGLAAGRRAGRLRVALHTARLGGRPLPGGVPRRRDRDHQPARRASGRSTHPGAASGPTAPGRTSISSRPANPTRRARPRPSETNAVDVLFEARSASPFVLMMPGWLDPRAEEQLIRRFERSLLTSSSSSSARPGSTASPRSGRASGSGSRSGSRSTIVSSRRRREEAFRRAAPEGRAMTAPARRPALGARLQLRGDLDAIAGGRIRTPRSSPISDVPDAPGLSRAVGAAAGLPVPRGPRSRRERAGRPRDPRRGAARPDLPRRLHAAAPPDFIARYRGRILNIHPRCFRVPGPGRPAPGAEAGELESGAPCTSSTRAPTPGR